MPPTIPAPDPAGLPAPAWLIVSLAILTFTLHLVAMNFLVGGSTMMWLALRRSKSDPFFALLAERISAALPVTMSMTITLGVAPLLFIQVLYGQAFYTSTILMAWPWLAIIALLMGAYYAIYAVRFRPEWLGKGVNLLAALATLAILCVGLLQVQNATIGLLPAKWGAMYKSSALGLHGNFTDPSLVPRYLHFMVGGFAIAGLGVMLLGGLWAKTEPEWAQRARAYGARWFLAATGVQVVVGLWFLFALPSPITKALIGGSRADSLLLLVGVVPALAACAIVKRMPWIATALTVVSVALMVGVRHRVRDMSLAPALDVYAQKVNAQWPLFAAFAVILVIGLVVVGWMLVQFARAGSGKQVKQAR